MEQAICHPQHGKDPHRFGAVIGHRRGWVSDIDQLRKQPEVYGHVAPDPTISRLSKVLSTVKPTKARPALALPVPQPGCTCGRRPAKTRHCMASARRALW